MFAQRYGEVVAQQDFAALEAVKTLNLPTRVGAVPAYFSVCCKERALEVQATLSDYQGIADPFGVKSCDITLPRCCYLRPIVVP